MAQTRIVTAFGFRGVLFSKGRAATAKLRSRDARSGSLRSVPVVIIVSGMEVEIATAAGFGIVDKKPEKQGYRNGDHQ